LTAVPPASSVPLGSVRGDPSKLEGGAAMKKTAADVAQAELIQEALPAHVQEALGELAAATGGSG